MLVVGISLSVRKTHNAAYFPHSPYISWDCGSASGKDSLTVRLHLLTGHPFETDIGIAACIDILNYGSIIVSVIIVRFADGHIIVLVCSKAQTVIVGLDCIITFLRSTFTVRTVLPPAVNPAGARLGKLIRPFTSEPERDSR